MQHYEMLFILPQEVTEESAPEAAQKVNALVQAQGANITHDESMGRKKFAYPVKGQKYGTYQIIRFDLEPEKLPALEEKLRLSGIVLRNLITTYRQRTAAEMAQEQQLRERIAASRKQKEVHEAQTKKEEEQKAAVAAGTAMPEKEDLQEKVSAEELEEKLKKILDEDIVD